MEKLKVKVWLFSITLAILLGLEAYFIYDSIKGSTPSYITFAISMDAIIFAPFEIVVIILLIINIIKLVKLKKKEEE